MALDDNQIFVIRRDTSNGQNNRQNGLVIGEQQSVVLTNIDIGVPGQTRKRPGLTLLENLGATAGTGLFGFEPSDSTNELIATYGGVLEGWPSATTFTAHKSDFVSGTNVKMLKIGESGEDDVLAVYIEGNNWFRMLTDHTFQDLGSTAGTGSDSPPTSIATVFFRNRWWILKKNLLYYSDAFPADYSTAFDTISQNYRIPVGEERALIAIRDEGIVCFGQDAVWSLNPSVTPAATDKAEKLIDYGCSAGNTVVQVGDDIFFLSSDGVRGLFRTLQDKVQAGKSDPISFPLKEEFESINWAQISKACAVYFDNKYFLSLPVDASTSNNEVWVYYPATSGWVVVTGWNVAAWAKIRVDGEERLYAIDSTNGNVYQAWKGFSDNGTAINYLEIGRKEDLGQPLVDKDGGELKIKALSSGDYDLAVYVSADDKEFVSLGTMNLAGNAPALPVSLPFTLADSNVIEGVFHLDSIGPWRQIRWKIQHNDTNGSDEIIIYERSVISYANEYQSE